MPIGIMISAAANARSIAKTHLLGATKLVGIGASRRSSISRVQPNSATSGKASVCIAGQHRRQRDEAGEEQVGVAVLRVAEAAEHLAEDEQQEERLQDHLREERGQLAPGDEEVAVEHREERAGAGGRAARVAASALSAASVR